MPLETIEDYLRLGEHLAEIREPFSSFALKHGYKLEGHVENGSWGYYPDLRIFKRERIIRTIHLSMGMDESGKKYEEFFPEIHYSVFAAAWIDDFDDLVRWSGPRLLIDRIPFNRLVENLSAHLDFFLGFAESVTEDYLIACDCTNKLNPPEE
ncbi:MAG: hypothetical protein O3C21_05580 [Verrucomicrobia bacterium]|nr:hypothetical protein [Verrucomicrobiota bacterium]